jgi:hypothetical protein
MIWNLDNLQECNGSQICINGKWVSARPINYKYRSFKEKVVESWKVFLGETESFKWPEGQ